ncbi:MAG TPA: nitrite/sulfite reductase, partial [Stellaceae bacterium]|nr:nitrite/sulfite reductase [Stellaceae bacterium]
MTIHQTLAKQVKGGSSTDAPYARIYRYDEYDREFLQERVAEFREQVARRMSGRLSEDEFKPFRLMNGLYLQLHAYMLRVAIPYGTLSSTQLRQLGYIARTYDKGYGHFTTRQNIQFNWPKLEEAPDILAALAEVDMHAIQTSGNCIRNVTADEYAGAAADEVVDPRIWAEILRQWSTRHPEFSFLPRKFKIAVTGSASDRAAVKVYDIGILAKHNDKGELGFEVYAGGGLGRTPYIGVKVSDWVGEADFLAFMEAILRVYNAYGRRDNIWRARIKILVNDLGKDEFNRRVHEEFDRLPRQKFRLDQETIEAIATHFAPPPFETLPARSASFEQHMKADK